MNNRTTIKTRVSRLDSPRTSFPGALVIQSDDESRSPFVWIEAPNGERHCVVWKELMHAIQAAVSATEFIE